MKIISLNTWGGSVKDRLVPFLVNHVPIDAWFFQEVFNSSKQLERGYIVPLSDYTPDSFLFETLSRSLPSYTRYFSQTTKEVFGLAAFIDPKIELFERGEILVARGEETEGGDNLYRKLQWFEIVLDGKKLLLMNTILTHRPQGKEDTQKRIEQSEKIINLMNMFDCPKILVGDFNLKPDTESIRMIEKSGMRNLIKEYNITSTRSELYKKEVKFADYIFVSPEIQVNEFKVMSDVVSDHLPLYLDFEIKN